MGIDSMFGRLDTSTEEYWSWNGLCYLVGRWQPGPGFVSTSVIVLSFGHFHVVAETNENLSLSQLVHRRPLIQLKSRNNCQLMKALLLRPQRHLESTLAIYKPAIIILVDYVTKSLGCNLKKWVTTWMEHNVSNGRHSNPRPMAGGWPHWVFNSISFEAFLKFCASRRAACTL